MSDVTPAATPAVTDTVTPAVTPAPAAPVVAATPAPAPSAPAGDPAWLNGRIQQAKESAVRDALKALGFEKPEDAKAGVEELKKRRDAELTETQRITAENAELKGKAARATELEASVKLYADAALAGLTQDQRDAIADIAGSDPAKVLKAVDRMRAAGMLNAPAAAPVTQAAPPVAPVAPVPAVRPPEAPAATTAPNVSAPTPAPAGGESHLATFERLEKQNPMLAAQYRLSNYAAITAERKARA